MNDFTASNGLKVGQSRTFREGITVDNCSLTSAEADALREFFRAEEDERLGRWRWPENPDFVVYAPVDFTHYVRVLNERDARLEVIHQERLDGRVSLMAQAARAYFEAHPEPKPWHDAAEGEAWVLRIGDDPVDEKVWMAEGDGPRFCRGGHSISCLSSSITAGRRIWPEVQS